MKFNDVHGCKLDYSRGTPGQSWGRCPLVSISVRRNPYILGDKRKNPRSSTPSQKRSSTALPDAVRPDCDRRKGKEASRGPARQRLHRCLPPAVLRSQRICPIQSTAEERPPRIGYCYRCLASVQLV